MSSLIRRALESEGGWDNLALTETTRLQKLLDVVEELDRINDLDSLLDRILLETRAFTNADAGTIYLVEQGRLRFSYNSQSGLLTTGSPNRRRYVYLNHTMPINERSIAGYVALHGTPVIVDDAYQIDNSVPYSFNSEFDRSASYRTTSMLTVPLKTHRGNIVGVMQLVNALDKETNEPIRFTDRDRLYVSLFGRNAAVAIERATTTRSIILRMIKMAELRDPKETGAHVNRVGAYSTEIYEHWAEKHGVSGQEIKRSRDLLRLGAMMHDVGKIAIPDAILKKPGRLSGEERAVMQEHTVVGARLFRDEQSELDTLSEEIALNHHERWDGEGYPGRVAERYRDPVTFGPGKRGEEIPLFGRIVGLADVYDALISRRTYKEPWDEEKVLATIRQESGRHFDPRIVEAFFDIQDVIRAIRERFSD